MTARLQNKVCVYGLLRNGGPAIVAPPFVCTGSASIFCDKLTLKITFRPAIGFRNIVLGGEGPFHKPDLADLAATTLDV
ncbi:hypothetical protein NQ317_005301 [Molorchus minor]|uniref:Uncharacterized protein n=1 Tax=Molorchus minor TaxID=1323400 RepID=A0ABQ9IZ42_9CUCU|nr:hypothetical protein NQ317_005301 [Molorchus minor]